jgi:hypothetical protein
MPMASTGAIAKRPTVVFQFVIATFSPLNLSIDVELIR